MQSRAPGFLRPEQSEPIVPIQEEKIRECCPGLKVEPWCGGKDDGVHPYWGPIRDSMTGFAVDETIRFRCSSGGAISALAMHALETSRVEQVLHIGPDPKAPLGNVTILSRSAEEILEGAGSRYAPSSPLQDVEKLLDAGVPTLFIGKPCDVSALRRLGRIDPRVDEVFPIKLSFFCGGVPSHQGARNIVASMGLDHETVAQFDFRGNGWPGPTVARDMDGRHAEMEYEESWGRYLSNEVQFRCKICPDPVGGVADIACADAWYGGESGYPQFAEAEGRSLILARSKVGRRLLQDATMAGYLVVQSLDPREIDLMQPAQARRKRLIAARMAACRLANRPVPDTRNLQVATAARQASIGALAREFLGTVRRIIQGRI